MTDRRPYQAAYQRRLRQVLARLKREHPDLYKRYLQDTATGDAPTIVDE